MAWSWPAPPPNAFPEGPIVLPTGKQVGYSVGDQLGDPLTDNSRYADGYRYHDAIHFGFMAILGWSPNSRSLLRVKRQSDPVKDECDDGAQSIFAEEGLAAVLSMLAVFGRLIRNRPTKIQTVCPSSSFEGRSGARRAILTLGRARDSTWIHWATLFAIGLRSGRMERSFQSLMRSYANFKVSSSTVVGTISRHR